MGAHSPQFPGRIRNRMIAIFLIPMLLLVAGSGFYYYRVARSALDEEMGLRLRTLAGSAVGAISPEAVRSFQPGDEIGWPYRNARDRLRRLMKLGNAERIYVFTPDHKILLDTDEDFLIGTEYFRLDMYQFELEGVFRDRSTASSTMFKGDDGRIYKSGYAPIIIEDQVVAAIGVEAGVQFFDVLSAMGKNMLVFAIIAVLVVVVLSLLAARRIERTIGRLGQSARRIGQGDFETTIVPSTNDEVGFLAHTLNEMRKSIVERDRYLQMLQRGIAHEVRNPLGGMGLFCDILTEELGKDENKIEHVRKIRREVDGLNKVVNDFLDFTREVTLDRRETDMESFLDDILMHYSLTIEGSNLSIVKNIDEGLGKVFMDPELVRRAMFNLINNAIQAMQEVGKLEICAEKKGNYLMLGVRDTGPGIPQEDLENIYTPFFTTKDKGTGLGLPFAKKIAENHGGAIHVESRPGKGTCVTLEIPLERE